MSEHADYLDALRRFHDRSDYEKGTITNPFGRAGDEGARGLARVRALLGEFDHPETRYAIVHIAGSKGKGSTCAFLSTILTTAGYRTGRYISPHLHTLRERIAVDDLPMSEAEFTASLDRVLQACEIVESREPELGQDHRVRNKHRDGIRSFRQDSLRSGSDRGRPRRHVGRNQRRRS